MVTGGLLLKEDGGFLLTDADKLIGIDKLLLNGTDELCFADVGKLVKRGDVILKDDNKVWLVETGERVLEDDDALWLTDSGKLIEAGGLRVADGVNNFVETGVPKLRDDDALMVDGAFELVKTTELELKDDGKL